MVALLGLIWIGSWALAFLALGGASSAFQESTATLLVINGTVALGTCGVIEAVNRLNRPADDGFLATAKKALKGNAS